MSAAAEAEISPASISNDVELDQKCRAKILCKLGGAIKKANHRGVRAILKKIPTRKELIDFVTTPVNDQKESLMDITNHLLSRAIAENREWQMHLEKMKDNDQGYICTILDLQHSLESRQRVRKLCNITTLMVNAAIGKYPQNIRSR